ncbi:unnamed protein product [Penicillium camemberti]|uniref:Str. FM013 n=1 Tax=Penicillium camemberti (strain FM 013) TaxID=1429867 RepID=A0A0G4PWM3_PENC3|nr:unnamed protein product [Penicillium camemberti]
MLAARYKRIRRMEDLEEAICRYYQAIETIPYNDPFSLS